MRGVLWALGRILQIGALGVTGYALLVGINGGSMQGELSLLLVGVATFALGYALARATQGGGS